MTRADLERTLARRLNPVSRAWQQVADLALARLGVSHSTGWCLVHLDRMGQGARQSDLAREIGVTEPSLVRTLHQLEATGMVERRTDPEDRRANHLVLTAQGHELAAGIEAAFVALRAELLADVPSTDIEATLRLCDAVTQRIADRRIQP
ncbi:MarR family transcriptional regulator [Sphingomonas naphthae]|uniref:MarR family transcriptional regulator n=1 Tax=Sphingomonas naphthae TaxID=1813468 RepID=A0ABY7TIZ5_9SPHN|nr:MarR family transcriptional regulator [Sphingomonas naphthae]WCT73003.1 MarR family transcriptional regulator [Sphingomonas naphthae]